MKTFILIFTFFSIPAFADFPLKDGKARVGDCKLEAHTRDWGTVERAVEIRLDTTSDKAGPNGQGPGYMTFMFDRKTGVPIQGFNLCSGYSYGPVKVETQRVGEYRRVKFSCGGNWQPIKGEAEIVINEKTKRVEHAGIDLRGAYTPWPYLTHTGPLKHQLEKFTCSASTYPTEKFVIVDGLNTIAPTNHGKERVSSEHAIVDSFKYKRARDSRDADRMIDEALEARKVD